MDADNRFERVRAAIEQLGPADHVCTLYDQRDEEVSIAVSYVRAGLERSELCVCVVDDGGKNILDALASEGIDTGAEMRRGRLVFFEKPLAQGLQMQDMLAKIEHYGREARRAGHAGFRIVGEMTWALDGDLKALVEFEARLNLNRVWERHACVGLCQFDVRRFTPETLREIIIVHPLVVIGDRVCRNPYFVAPERYLSPDWPLHEADWMMTNLEQLQRAQDCLQASQERYRALSRRLLEQQEHERASLARELHDQLGQSLVAVLLNLEATPFGAVPTGNPKRASEPPTVLDSVAKTEQVQRQLQLPSESVSGYSGSSLRSERRIRIATVSTNTTAASFYTPLEGTRANDRCVFRSTQISDRPAIPCRAASSDSQ